VLQYVILMHKSIAQIVRIFSDFLMAFFRQL
jgi:hypothetical protein